MKIDNVELTNIAVRQSQYPESNKKEFLLVGRSNVGKSSFINSIIARKNFARTSSKPGKTQTLNFYLINDLFYLVDVPGYGYANVDKQTQKKLGLMIEEYLKNRDNLCKVFLLVDYRHKPMEDDIIMYDFLKYYKLDVVIVATKYDKVSSNQKQKQDKLIKEAFNLSEAEDFVRFSSLTKKGKEEIYAIIESSLNTNN